MRPSLTCCASKYLKLLSLIAIQLVPKKGTHQEPKGEQLVPLPVLSDDTVISSPNIWWKWNWSNIECQIFCLKKYTLGKWGHGEAFNQNSLMQLFNGDRRIVHWVCLFLPVEKSRRGLHHCCVHLMWFKKIDNYVCLMCATLQSRLLIYQPIYLLQLIYPVHMHLCPKLPHLPTSLPAIGEFFGAQNVVSVNHPLDNKHMYVDPAAVSDFVANILWR